MPSTPPPTGRLSIASEPSSASILIDTKDIDVKTPDTFYLPLGSHLVTLTKDKFADFSFCVDIEEGAQIEKSITLVKPTDEPIPTGELKIESTPSHSAIHLDLEDTGLLTPETLELPEGSHLLTLKQDSCYDDESFCVEIVQDKLLEKFIELKKATGELTITSEPSYANLWLREFKDTESKSTKYLTPETLTLTPTLPDEPITITLKREGYDDFSFDTEIIKGKLIEKHIELVKTSEEVLPPIPPDKSAIKILSRPTYASIFIGEEDIGKITPELIILDPGEHEITLKKESYENKTFSVTIEEGELQEKFVELTKIEGVVPSGKSGVKITSKPSSASIHISDKITSPLSTLTNLFPPVEDTGRITPELLILEPGLYGISLRKGGYEVRNVFVTIEEGKELEKFIELVKVEGVVSAEESGVKIVTKPSAASIFVNGEDIHRITPELIILDPEEHEITVKKEGYEDKTVTITIEEGKQIEKFIQLTRIEGVVPPDKSGVKLTSKPTAASILIKGKDIGRITPELVLLEPGEHQITLKKPGYLDKTTFVTIEEGKEIERYIELTKVEEAEPPEKTGVKITSKPTAASIFVNGDNTERITPELLILKPGTYTITLKKPGYEDRMFSVTIEEGKELEKFIELLKIEDIDKTGIRIISTPSSASIFIGEKDTGRITPEVIILDPETAEITFTLKKERYLDRTVSVTIVKGEVSEKFVELVKTEDADKTKLRIVSTPSSASIFISREDTERITPELILLDPGTHELTLKKEGYENKTFFVTIEKGELQEKFIKLVKLTENTGELYITSIPRYAKVYVNNEDTLLITPVLLSLTPAMYNITLKRGGYSDVPFTVTIIKGKKIEKFIEFPEFGNGEEGKRIGQFHIESKPQHAEIWEDGSNLELLTPETLTFTPGTKSITLKKSGFDDYTFSTQIVAGEKSEKLCELTKSTGELFLQSRPSRAKIFVDDKDMHLLTPEKLILSPGKKRIVLVYPAFLSAFYTVDIVKGGKIEKFHRFAIPRDAIKINKDDSFDDNIHVRDYCMQCDNPPEYDVLFSEGNLRAWLCAEHCKVFVRESSEKINAIRRIDNGKATSKFRENINPNVLSRFIRDMQRTSQKKQLATDEELAPVNASGVELGEKITLKEILPYFKSFYHTKPYVSLIGGICNRGSTTGDIDIFINSNHRDLATEFRIVRSFPQDYWHRFNFRYPYQEKTHPGKFTNHIDIYDEKIEAIREPELVLMSVPKKVELFKSTFPLLKPAHGHYKGEEYSIDKLIEVVNAKPEWYEKGTYVQKKFDGVHVRCDVQRNYESGFDVIIWSEEGNDITKNLPTLRKELGEASKGHKISIVGELEFWEDEKHQSRQQTTAIIHTKEVHPDEKKVILNTFDILFYDKDIHNEPHSERLKSHATLKETAHIKKADYTLVDSPTELRKAVEHYSALPGSEGAYLKRADFPYELDGKSLLNLKYKNTFSIDAKVVDVHEVKDANAFNYLCVIEDEKGNDVPIGRTYNTSIKVSKGDILKVEFVNLNKYETEDGKVWYNWWSPHVIMSREDKKKPDNTLTAEKLVEASKGTVAEKPWPKRYTQSDSILKQLQPYEFNTGKIVKVNGKTGIISKVIMQKGEEK